MAQSTYTMNYSNFIGADMSSDPRVVSRNRLAYSVNMWRDYESEQGAAVETFPGFRRVVSRWGNEDIYSITGLWHYKGPKNEYIVYHKDQFIYAFKIADIEHIIEPEELCEGIYDMSLTSFVINNNLYLVSSGIKKIIVISEDTSGQISAQNVEEYYVPTTYYNGQPYEQRNAFTNRVTQIDTGAGIEDETEQEIEQDSDASTIKVRKYILYERANGGLKVFVNNVEYTSAASNRLEEGKYATVSSNKYIKYVILREEDVTQVGYI